MFTRTVRRMGKGQRIGSYMVAEGDRHGGVFAGYTKCEHCKTELKIVMRVHEARELANVVGTDLEREGWKVKLAKRVQKWAQGVIMRKATEG